MIRHRPNFAIAILVLLAGLSCSPSRRLPVAPAEPSTAGIVPSSPELSAAVASGRDLLRRRLDEMPGLAVAVARRSGLLWSEGLGVADLDSRRPATEETRFRVYSVAKPITGTLAVRLHQRGVVDLHVPIRRYLPELPDASGGVTLAQLLSHSAGIRHYADGEWAKVSSVHCETARQAIEPFRDDPLVAPPGRELSYSSFGFVLASAVLEAAAGAPFPELLRREIFEPAGMNDTVVDTPPYDPKRTTTFYRTGSLGRVREERPWDNSCKLGGGGFLSTAEDLARFGSALLRGDLVDSEGQELLLRPHAPTEDGEPAYGLGWGLARDDEGALEYAAHSGGSPGGRSYLLVDPEHGLVVALAANLEGERFGEEARTLRELFVEAGRVP